MKPTFEPPRSGKSPCPCGSGKKYKHCHGARPKPVSRPKRRWLGWAVAAAVVVGVGTLIGQRANAPQPSGGLGFPLFREGSGGFGATGYASIDGVDMSSLNETQRVAVMQKANTERCFCGCRMTLAQCINTDTACPLRSVHFQRARQLVAQARGSS